MFIKKDLRKIPEIIASVAANNTHDEGSAASSSSSGSLRSLHLAKRGSEFQGNVKILSEPAAASAGSSSKVLQELESLSLYDCDLHELDGIGRLVSLKELSVGRNPLTQIPSDMSQLINLKRLWLDDCRLQGPLPSCLLELSNLQELRLSSNQITSLPEDLDKLVDLQVLCVDNNQLTRLPSNLPPHLTLLQVRENLLTNLPPLPLTLKVLQASSNQISSMDLPQSGGMLWDLTHVYLNRNQLNEIPEALLQGTSNLHRLNLSHNQIHSLSEDFVLLHGEPNEFGLCENKLNKNACVVLLIDNPVLVASSSTNCCSVVVESADENKNDDAMDVDEEPATAVSAENGATASVTA